MVTIYKYKFETKETQTLKICKLRGSNNFKDQFLKIDVQNSIPCFWCIVDTEEEIQEVPIRIIGTGCTPGTAVLLKENYLGTYMTYNGYVYHVFLEHQNK